MDACESTEGQASTRDGAQSEKPLSSPSRFWRHMRLALWGGAGIACALAVGFGFFAEHVSLLTQPANMRAADGIIVLTGGQSRLAAAVDLLKSGKGKRLLISGVNPHSGRKALREVTGGDKRLFSCCVDIDHEAIDTVGNAEQSAKWMAEHDYGSVILVTNNYHMPRSLAELSYVDPATEFIPYPVVNSDLKTSNWFTDPNAMRVMLAEYAKVLLASARNITGLGRHTGLRSANIAGRS
jgi:uncharacterized SAM-binding protein YcdF (DUF218 family)